MKYFLLILLNFSFYQGYSQKKSTDSLLNLEKTMKDDSLKADVLGVIADHYIEASDFENGIEYASRLRILSEQIGFKKGYGKSYHLLFTMAYMQSDFEKCKLYGSFMKDYFKEIKDEIQYGGTLFQLANLATSQSRYDEALAYIEEAEEIFKRKNFKKGLALIYAVKGGVYRDLADYEKALDLMFQSLQIMEEMKSQSNAAKMMGNIALLYEQTNNFEQALKYYEKSDAILSKLGNKGPMATTYLNLGVLYTKQNLREKALENYHKAKKIFLETNNLHSLAVTYDNIGYQYILTKPDTALFYIDKALAIIEKLDDARTEAKFLSHKCNTYEQYNRFEEAIPVCEKSLKLAAEIGAKDIEGDIHEIMVTIHREKGDFEKALTSFESFIALRDSTLNSEKQRELERKDLKYEFEKKENNLKIEQEKKELLYKEELKRRQLYFEFEQEQSEMKAESEKKQLAFAEEMKRKKLQLKNEKDKAKIKEANTRKEMSFKADLKQKEIENIHQRNLNLIFIIALGVTLLLSLLVLRGYQQKKKANTIISLQKLEVEKQKLVVEEKNKEIIDSIAYAKRLQDAILPPIQSLKDIFHDSFILYKPKDIVAGDFYWLEKVDDKVFLAAADCTGHGVPGALVSVVCSNALNRTVKEFGITETGKILDKVRELVVETFSKSESQVKDGMDISICSYDLKSNNFSWSGANNPVWIIQKNDEGKMNLNEIRGDKQPVGIHPSPIPFTEHKIPLKKGDKVYLFTDGFADQFGGDKGKKFKYKNFQKIILGFFNDSMQEQESVLNEAHEKWKSDFEQTDDICIIGFSI